MKEEDAGAAKSVLEIDKKLDELKIKCRDNYLKNVNKQKANIHIEIITMDTVAAIMKIGDHLVNVADAIINDFQWEARRKS